MKTGLWLAFRTLFTCFIMILPVSWWAYLLPFCLCALPAVLCCNCSVFVINMLLLSFYCMVCVLRLLLITRIHIVNSRWICVDTVLATAALLLAWRCNSGRVLAFSTVPFHLRRSWTCSVHFMSFVFFGSFLTSLPIDTRVFLLVFLWMVSICAFSLQY